MRGPYLLRQRVGLIKSRMGGFVPGSHVAVRGLDLHDTFRHSEWIDLFFFACTGKRFSTPQLRLLQSLWTYSSYPDVRLWPNRIAGLAGTTRSTANLGLAAAHAACEATIFGRGPDRRAITFLIETLAYVNDGGTIDECVRKELDSNRGIAGYGRPLVSKDERIEPTLKLANQLNLDKGPHLRLAFEIDDYLGKGRWRMRINQAAVAAALAADIGLSPEEYYICGFPAFLAGMVPCYLEALEEPEGALFPIPCEDIAYQGVAPRSWSNRTDKNQ
jgi:hypothetical protein